jgi:hypothetical protein
VKGRKYHVVVLNERILELGQKGEFDCQFNGWKHVEEMLLNDFNVVRSLGYRPSQLLVTAESGAQRFYRRMT